KGIQCMPSGFTPVVIDLHPSMKVTIPWDKQRHSMHAIWLYASGNPKRKRGTVCPSLTLRVVIEPLPAANPLNQQSPSGGEG
ncbi:MAG: hypothetical protein K9M08_18365, partial [Pirellula sp.]|nr:hypothetical protein [Pirellula sp.]